MLALSYVLPLKASTADDLRELAAYIRWLSGRCEVIVVDDSAPPLWDELDSTLLGMAQHRRPDRDLQGLNGKVNGVVTGLRRASHQALIIGDDDVRYDDQSLRRMADLLSGADLVRPQNWFSPLPWHARWDTARTLLNRAGGGDWPGTIGVRRDLVLKCGGYDGDCLFENLELERTVRAAGGRTMVALDLLVRRIPPDTSHFFHQRVRQAYDEFARPVVLACELAVLPSVVWATATRRWGGLAAGATFAVLGAESGRRRCGGTAVYPASSSILAPGWILERGICVWLAIGSRIRRGGVRYGSSVITRSATPTRVLRRSLRSPAGPRPQVGASR